MPQGCELFCFARSSPVGGVQAVGELIERPFRTATPYSQALGKVSLDENRRVARSSAVINRPLVGHIPLWTLAPFCFNTYVPSMSFDIRWERSISLLREVRGDLYVIFNATV